MTKNKLTLILYFLSTIFLTSCYDRVQAKDRLYVITMGIDSTEKGFKVTLLAPSLASKDDKESIILEEEGETILNCINRIDANISKKVYFGQTKLVILGRDLLENEEKFKQTLDSLERNPMINRKIMLFGTDKSANIVLNGEVNDKKDLGVFIADYFKNYNNKSRIVFKETIESFIIKTRVSKDGIIPKISLNDKFIKIGGAFIIKNYKFKGLLTEEEVKYYLLIKGIGKGTVFFTDYDNKKIPMEIYKDKSDLTIFVEKNICEINININSIINEFVTNNDSLSNSYYIKELEESFENKLKNELENLTNKIYNDLKTDSFDLEDKIRKYNYDFYSSKNQEDMENLLKDMKFVINVKVNIESIGSIR